VSVSAREYEDMVKGRKGRKKLENIIVKNVEISE
jgi:hypothetical protein